MCRRRRNRADEIDLVADKTLRNVLEIGLIRLCILAVDREVLPLLVAACLQPVDKATVRRIERIVLHQLNDTDLIGLLPARLLTFPTACERQKPEGGDAKSNCLHCRFHPHRISTFSFLSNF